MTRSELRLGAGAGFAGDRIDPAADLVRRGNLDYLVFECLGERTVAASQARRLADPSTGYDPLLGARMRAVLPAVVPGRTRLVTNSGAANPAAAGELVAQVAKDLDQRARIAVVSGDDVLEAVRRVDPVVWETGESLSGCPEELISANAYLGAEALLPALEHDANVIITGRVTDPALYLAPMIHEFGWSLDDWEVLGAGTVVGHLLECAGQLTGGYFADPVTKPVPNMARLGFPFADVTPDGGAVLRKLPDTGGRLDTRTVTEQLLYEVEDPTTYLTPDVTADFSGVRLTQAGEDTVEVAGASGRSRPDDLKVTLGFLGGWHGEGQITYAGPRALPRAQLAAEIVMERLVTVHGLPEDSIGIEYIGAGAAFRGLARDFEPLEVRLRVSARTTDPDRASAVGWEVESLYTNGPAGGGGASQLTRESVIVRSCLLPRDLAAPSVDLLET